MLTKRTQMKNVRYAALGLKRGTLTNAHKAVAARAIEKNKATAEPAYLWNHKYNSEEFVSRHNRTHLKRNTSVASDGLSTALA
jgi:hypothetical protein